MKRLFVIMILAQSLWGQEDILIGLTVMDVITTNYIVSTGGMELNPLLPADDLFALSAIKGVLAVAYLMTNPPKKRIWIMNIVLSTAVINNLWQIEGRNHQKAGG